MAAGLLLTLMLALGLAAWLVLGSDPDRGVRIAIMSFADEAHARHEPERIGERILVELAHRRPDAALVGPRSTQPLRVEGLDLPAIADRLEVSYILNAKHLRPDHALLVELIHTPDGKHVWVRAYDDLTDWPRIAEEITEGVAATVPID